MLECQRREYKEKTTELRSREAHVSILWKFYAIYIWRDSDIHGPKSVGVNYSHRGNFNTSPSLRPHPSEDRTVRIALDRKWQISQIPF